METGPCTQRRGRGGGSRENAPSMVSPARPMAMPYKINFSNQAMCKQSTTMFEKESEEVSWVGRVDIVTQAPCITGPTEPLQSWTQQIRKGVGGGEDDERWGRTSATRPSGSAPALSMALSTLVAFPFHACCSAASRAAASAAACVAHPSPIQLCPRLYTRLLYQVDHLAARSFALPCWWRSSLLQEIPPDSCS